MDYLLNIESIFKCLEIYYSFWCGIIFISYIIYGDKNICLINCCYFIILCYGGF